MACFVTSLATACDEATPVTAPVSTEALASFSEIPAVGNSLRGHEPVRVSERDAARLIARALAASLRERAVVNYVKAALASSGAREQKLHFASFLSGRGGPLVPAMLRSGVTMSQLSEAVRSVRDLEFYMPVGAHRDRWTASVTPLVAIALHEDDSPEAYDGDGNRRILNRVFPPVEPVLVFAPVETDLRTQIELNARGKAEYPCTPTAAETLSEAAVRCRIEAPPDRRRPLDNHVPSEITGLYVTAIALARDVCGGECWAWGNPEYQVMTFARTPTSGSQMQLIQCSGDDALPEYRWNMDGRSWAGRGLLLTRSQMDATLHIDAGWMHQFWEDDQDNCNLVPRVDPWAEAWAVIQAVDEAWTAWQDDDYEGFIYGVQAAANGIQGLVMGGDDYIGNIVNEDESVWGDGAASTHNMVIQVGTNGDFFIGRATIRPYTASGPYVGPVVSVRLSHANGTQFPIGSGIQLSAYGVDMFDTHVPNRPVSWSSSNPAVASVDASGFVSGYQEGAAVITATIDGVSLGTTLYPKPVGAPVSTRIDHEFITLAPDQWMYIYARLYDSNGWEVPTPGNYLWSSSDPSSCQVGYGAVDGEAYVVGRGGMGAQITVTSSEGLTDTMYCSVNGGDARIPARKRRLEPAVPTTSATPRLSKTASQD